MSSITTIDKTQYACQCSFTIAQITALSAMVIVSLAAIGIGVAALQASAGNSLWMFHSLGSMGSVGGWTFIGMGTSVSLVAFGYGVHKSVVTLLVKSSDSEEIPLQASLLHPNYQVATHTSDKSILKKMTHLVKNNEKQIQKGFELLGAQRGLDGLGAKDEGAGKFFMWESPEDQDASQAILLIFQIKGERQAIDLFSIKRVDECASNSDPFEKEMGDFIEHLDQQEYSMQVIDLALLEESMESNLSKKREILATD